MLTHHRANNDWANHVTSKASCYTTDTAQLAVLMDIRAELRRIRSVLECHNTTAIPEILRRISRNTAKRKRIVRKVTRKKGKR